MKRNEKFEVAVAAFEALLSNNDLWSEYFEHFEAQRTEVNSEEIYTDWKKWASKTEQHKWIASAFFWDKTPQGKSVWARIDYQWLIMICENLNK